MSFSLFGGRPQPSSEQKIAAAETEIEMVSDMFNRYAVPVSHCSVVHFTHWSVGSCAVNCAPNEYFN